ncbi:MAG: putative aliphatic sulfonates transport permease protein SsuC [Alphaproteobacteria bacterium MarineAlpha3_Bin5]|nr:MAG: putative aliphatic sulfonates transport permease protein SsuC [Alphaproteobacteria bacterium MarineAlpha3_Bin5]
MPRRIEQIWHHSRGVILPAAAVILLGLLWEASVHIFSIPVYLLPAPSVIWVDFISKADLVYGHTTATVNTILGGFLLSIAISFPLAVMIASSAVVANTIYPLLVLTQSIPKVALAPILVVALGAGEMPRVIVTFLVAFFPLVTSLATGLLAVPKDLIELSRSYRGTWWQEMWLIRLPWSVPFLFNGLKLAITFAVVGATVGEFVAADKGLGYQIMAATSFFNTSVAFGALVILSLLGIVLFQAVAIIERVLFPWSSPQE